MPSRIRQAVFPGMEDLGEPEHSAPETSTAVAPPPAVPAMHATLSAATSLAPASVSPAPIPTAPGQTSAPRAASQPRDAAGRSASLGGASVYVIDMNNLLFQVFHAVPEMTGPAGQPVNAIFGFTRDLLSLIEQKKPTHMFCALDMPGPTFRDEMYAEYKAGRSEFPEELAAQLPSIHRMVEALGIPLLGVEGYEADDVMATIARQADEEGAQCYVVTSDKDCRQLITDKVRLYNVRKGQVYDAAALAADWGVRPDQVVDFMALMGDSVDNVPGVPQIGPKAARELIEKFGTLDVLLARVGEVPGKKGENLKQYRDRALLSRDLVRLDAQTPVQIDWRLGRVGRFDLAAIKALCAEFGFHRIAQQAAALAPAGPPQNWQADYRTVDTLAGLAELVATMSGQPRISFDTETTSVSPTQADLVGCSFAWRDGEAYYVPLRAPAADRTVDPAAALDILRPLLEDPRVGKVGQNLKYDMIVMRTAGVEVRGVACDTMVASYLLEAGERNHGLDDLSRRYLDHETIEIVELIGAGKSQKRMDEVPVAAVTPYAAEDADCAWRLAPLLEARLHESDLTSLFVDVELPLIDVLVELECNGIRVDVAVLKELSRQFGDRLAGIEQRIYALAGHEFNIASNKQLQQVLFQELKLPASTKTKTGLSTDVSVLEELAAQHELPAKIIEYRQFAKLKNTYVDALPELVNPRTGRVHCSFQQAVAATGRLSCSDPNLQNIPVRTDEGRAIRAAFLPGHAGWKLLAADYSQIELRVLAHFSRDERLQAAFAAGEDIHRTVAAQVHGVAPADVTYEMRRRAKAINFGIVYGQSPFGLGKALGITQEEAAAFIDAYFARYPGVERFIMQTLADCAARGYVKTILGRRRAIRGIRSGAGRQRNLPERTAINTVIQGSAADLIKLAMLRVHRQMKARGMASKMLLQIHDELVFEVCPSEIEPLTCLVSAEMQQVGGGLDAPLGVDIELGDNWAET